MGKWEEQQEVKKEGRDRDKSRRENLGKYFFDLSKIAFTVLVVGAIIPLYSEVSRLDNWYVILTGVIFTFIFAFTGNRIFKR